MYRSPLCSLVEMFPYIHSLSNSDAAAENKASKTLLGSGNLISISLKKQAGQMVLSSFTVACARALDLAMVAYHKRLCQLVYWVYCTEGRRAGWGGCSEWHPALFCLFLLPAAWFLSKSITTQR